MSKQQSNRHHSAQESHKAAVKSFHRSAAAQRADQRERVQKTQEFFARVGAVHSFG